MDFQVNVKFPDENKMTVQTREHTIMSDIADEAQFPSPGDYFLAAVAACTAANARGYCKTHHLPFPLEVKVTAHMDDQTEFIDEVRFEILLPAAFPEKRKDALLRAAETCWVKQLWLHPPSFHTHVSLVDDCTI